MVSLICPNCKSHDIQNIKTGRYTTFGCVLLLLGIPLLLLNGVGVIFIAVGLFLGCITKSSYRCKNCRSEL
jgi:hypothetical protein